MSAHAVMPEHNLAWPADGSRLETSLRLVGNGLPCALLAFLAARAGVEVTWIVEPIGMLERATPAIVYGITPLSSVIESLELTDDEFTTLDSRRDRGCEQFKTFFLDHDRSLRLSALPLRTFFDANGWDERRRARAANRLDREGLQLVMSERRAEFHRPRELILNRLRLISQLAREARKFGARLRSANINGSPEDDAETVITVRPRRREGCARAVITLTAHAVGDGGPLDAVLVSGDRDAVLLPRLHSRAQSLSITVGRKPKMSVLRSEIPAAWSADLGEELRVEACTPWHRSVVLDAADGRSQLCTFDVLTPLTTIWGSCAELIGRIT